MTRSHPAERRQGADEARFSRQRLRQPERKGDCHRRRQAKPGHRVLQMIVGQIDAQRPRNRQAPGRLWAFELDEEGRHLAPILGLGDSLGIAHEPQIVAGIRPGA